MNNPTNGIDVDGEFAIAAATIGGAVAGTVISGLSYLADNGYNSGIWGAVIVGMITGALGGAAGMYDDALKCAFSVCVGAIATVYTGITTEGTVSDKVISSISAGVTAALATAISAFKFDINGLASISTAFASYATTISISVPAEIVNKYVNNSVKKLVKSSNTKNTSKIKMTETEIRRTYGGMYLLE